VFQYLGRPAPVSIVILYCICYYCMTLCAKFINKKISKQRNPVDNVTKC